MEFFSPIILTHVVKLKVWDSPCGKQEHASASSNHRGRKSILLSPRTGRQATWSVLRCQAAANAHSIPQHPPAPSTTPCLDHSVDTTRACRIRPIFLCQSWLPFSSLIPASYQPLFFVHRKDLNWKDSLSPSDTLSRFHIHSQAVKVPN